MFMCKSVLNAFETLDAILLKMRIHLTRRLVWCVCSVKAV